MIEKVVVDLGGVAARFRPERRLGRLASISHLTEELIKERLFNSGLEDRAERGEYPPAEVIANVLAALDGRVSAADLIAAWAMAFEPDTQVAGCLGLIQVPTVLLTNNGPLLDACIDGPLRELRVTFDDIICSWHLKARKPEAIAFERAAERLGCSPNRLLLLDDSEENVNAALQCGWDASLVTSIDDLVDALSRRPGLREPT